jgi:hypothetical protein
MLTGLLQYKAIAKKRKQERISKDAKTPGKGFFLRCLASL